MKPLLDRLAGAPFGLWLGLWCVALTVALTWPTAIHLDRAVLGSPHADGIKHLWTLWWMRAELLQQHQIPFETAYVNYPEGMALYPIEPLNGLLVSVLGFLPLVAATNLAALLNLTGTGLAAGLLGREVSGSRWGGLASATLLQGSAMALFTIDVGVGELQHLWWLPLGGWVWLRLRDTLRWPYAVGLGLALAGATLSCFYHGFFLATAISALALSTLWAGRQTPALLLRYGVAAGLGLLIVLPVVSTFAGSYGGGEPPQVGLLNYIRGDYGQPVTDPVSARLALPELVMPRRGLREGASMELLGYGGGRYLGWVAGLLGLGGLILKPRKAAPWVLAGLVGVLLAVGSFWVWDGQEATTAAGARYRLPFFYLNRALGYVSEPLNFPVRFLAVTAMACAVVSSLVVSRLPKPWMILPLAVVGVLDVQRHQLISRPLPSFAPWDFSELAPMAEDPQPTVDLSQAWRSDKEIRYASISAQVVHQSPIQAVPLARIEFFATQGRDMVGALPSVQALGQAFQGSQIVLDPGELERDLALLHHAGFHRLMILGIGPERSIHPQARSSLAQHLGTPWIDGEHALVWEIPEPTVGAEQLQRWQAEWERQIEASKDQQSAPGPQLR
ncbi:MAG: hypothetical protein VX899_17940 [Myxococcota bacterium]|nr:hypothetical protein [Myxococcota bacterium]